MEEDNNLSASDGYEEEDLRIHVKMQEGIQDAKTIQKIRKEVEGENNYEFPENDDKLFRRSNMLQNLLVCFNLQDQVKAVTDLAFDAVDEDGSGGLDQGELHTIMTEVSLQMGVTPPTP